jgi:large subunit ribosomal protein L21
MSYAVISVGGKQYLVREGERLLVDRLPEKEGATFKPRVLLASHDSKPAVSPEKVAVSARVVSHTLGEKIRIGKLKRRTGYRRHTGFRARLSQIEIQSIGAAGQKAAAAPKAKAAPKPEKAPAAKAEAAVPAPARAPAGARAAKPKAEAAAAKPAAKAPARKPAAQKATPRKATPGKATPGKATQEEAAPAKSARRPRPKKEG